MERRDLPFEVKERFRQGDNNTLMRAMIVIGDRERAERSRRPSWGRKKGAKAAPAPVEKAGGRGVSPDAALLVVMDDRGPQ